MCCGGAASSACASRARSAPAWTASWSTPSAIAPRANRDDRPGTPLTILTRAATIPDVGQADVQAPNRVTVADFLLAIDQGTTSTRAILFDAALTPVATAQQEFAPDLSGARPGRARPGGDLVDDCRDRARGDGEGRRRRARHRRHRHHQPARDHGGVGSRDRPADPQRDRLAGPPHRRCLRHAAAGRPRADDHGAHRAAARSLFLGHQDRLAARSRRRRAGGRASGQARLRHGG